MDREVVLKKIKYAEKLNKLTPGFIQVDFEISNSKVSKSKRMQIMGICYDKRDNKICIATKKLAEYVTENDLPDGAITLMISRYAGLKNLDALGLKGSITNINEEYVDYQLKQYYAYKYSYLVCSGLYKSPDKLTDVIRYVIICSLDKTMEDEIVNSVIDLSALLADLDLDYKSVMNLLKTEYLDFSISNNIEVGDLLKQGLITTQIVKSLCMFAEELDRIANDNDIKGGMELFKLLKNTKER